jgi:hypothetical protein
LYSKSYIRLSRERGWNIASAKAVCTSGRPCPFKQAQIGNASARAMHSVVSMAHFTWTMSLVKVKLGLVMQWANSGTDRRRCLVIVECYVNGFILSR